VAETTPNHVSNNLESGARLAIIGIVVNAVLSLVKVSAGLLGHSYALIADGIESLLDIGGSLVIWGGLKVAQRPPDETHPYGHGKAEPLAALVVSLFVLGAALALAIESVREISMPHHAPAKFTLAVLVLVIAVKEFLFRKVIQVGEDAGSTAVKTDAWHHRSDAITSLAAFIGISIALVGGPGWESADDYAALLACAIISFNGWRMFKPAVYELLDTAPPRDLEKQVRATAMLVPGVAGTDKCRLRKMGLQFYVDLHVDVDAEMTVRESHAIAHKVKDAIRSSLPSVADVLVHIEPAE
jgi:cation diffusion facilitator family transporter